MVFPFLIPLLSAATSYATSGDLKTALLGGVLGMIPGLGAAAGGAGSAATEAGKLGVEAILKQQVGDAVTRGATEAAVQGAGKAALEQGVSQAALQGVENLAPQAIGDAIKQGATGLAAPGAAQAAAPAQGGIRALMNPVNNWAQNHKLQTAMIASTVANMMNPPKMDEAGNPQSTPGHEGQYVMSRGPMVPWAGQSPTVPDTPGMGSAMSTYRPGAYNNPANLNNPGYYSQYPNSVEHTFFPNVTQDGWMANAILNSTTDPNGQLEEGGPEPRGGLGGIMEQYFQKIRRRSNGGPVYGPGTTTSDDIPAISEKGEIYALSHNEHILPADFVKIMGNGDYDRGHREIMAQVARVRKAVYGNDI